MHHSMSFGDILDAADLLPLDEQAELVSILSRRLARAGHERLVSDVEEARREFAEGQTTSTTPDKLMDEILR